MSYAQQKTSNYFDNISAKEINAKMAYLQKVLPRKCTRKNYQLSNKLLKVNDSGIHEGNLQENLQVVADRMREHLKISRRIQVLTVDYMEGGKFEQMGDLCCIYVNRSLGIKNYYQKLAILAHEITHYYLIYQHNVFLKNEEENELLTELCAIYIGFGFLLLKGYDTFDNRREAQGMIYSSKVGYINCQLVRRIIVKTAYIRRQNPMWIVKNAGMMDVGYFVTRLGPLILEYQRAKARRRFIALKSALFSKSQNQS